MYQYRSLGFFFLRGNQASVILLIQERPRVVSTIETFRSTYEERFDRLAWDHSFG